MRASWYERQRARDRERGRTGGPVPPDFVGVGVQRGGTTWWYELIVSHPSVYHRGRPKQLHFLDSLWRNPTASGAAARYHAYFARPPGMVAGEWTPRYLSLPWAPAALQRLAPDARVLVLLRDPVERYRSGLGAVGAKNAHDLRPIDALEAHSRGLYAEQLRRLYAWFPRDQVLVLQYEKVAVDPLPYLSETYRFIGVDDDFVPDDLERRAGVQSGEFTLDAEARRVLVRTYECDVESLLQLVPGLDLNLWPNFAHLV